MYCSQKPRNFIMNSINVNPAGKCIGKDLILAKCNYLSTNLRCIRNKQCKIGVLDECLPVPNGTFGRGRLGETCQGLEDLAESERKQKRPYK